MSVAELCKTKLPPFLVYWVKEIEKKPSEVNKNLRETIKQQMGDGKMLRKIAENKKHL